MRAVCSSAISARRAAERSAKGAGVLSPRSIPARGCQAASWKRPPARSSSNQAEGVENETFGPSSCSLSSRAAATRARDSSSEAPTSSATKSSAAPKRSRERDRLAVKASPPSVVTAGGTCTTTSAGPLPGFQPKAGGTSAPSLPSDHCTQRTSLDCMHQLGSSGCASRSPSTPARALPCQPCSATKRAPVSKASRSASSSGGVPQSRCSSRPAISRRPALTSASRRANNSGDSVSSARTTSIPPSVPHSSVSASSSSTSVRSAGRRATPPRGGSTRQTCTCSRLASALIESSVERRAVTSSPALA